MEAVEKIVTFHLPGDSVAAVELKTKIDGDKFYVFDEGKHDWIPINVSMFIKEDLMATKGMPRASLR